MTLVRVPQEFAQRVFAWTVKELRERMPVVIGIVVALPLLYVLAITTFSRNLATAPPEPLELSLAGITLALVWFGLAGDTLATEVAGGGPLLVRRQPRGMLALFVAKLVVLGTLTAGLAWYSQHAFCWIWQALATEPLATSSASTFSARLASGSNAGLLATWMAMPLLAWPLVTGAWIGRSGAASLAALLLVGVLVVPAWFAFMYAPWLLPWTPREAMGPLALALGVVGLTAALVSWTIGWGRQRRPWTPALAGATTVLASLAALGGWAYADFRAWSVVRADDSLRIASAYLGADGDSLWLTVYKGLPFADGKVLEFCAADESSTRGTPIRTWRVDLASRHVDIVANGESTWPMLPGSCAIGDPFGPQRLLCALPVLSVSGTTEDQPTRYYDTRSAEPVATLPRGMFDARIQRLLQSGLRELAIHRDAADRRVWIRHGRYEREGQEEPTADRVAPIDYQRMRLSPVSDGWVGAVFGDDGQHHGFLDREGQFHRFAENEFWVPQRLLDGRHFLRAGVGPRAGQSDPNRLRVLDLLTGEVVVERDAPSSWTVISSEGSVLVAGSVDGHVAFSLWDPIEDRSEALTWRGAGLPLTGMERVEVGAVGRHPDGRVVLYAQAKLPTTSYGNERSLGVLLLDPTRREVRQITASTPPLQSYVALENDGSLVAIEDRRRIVRLGPEPGQREVLFPFPQN